MESDVFIEFLIGAFPSRQSLTERPKNLTRFAKILGFVATRNTQPLHTPMAAHALPNKPLYGPVLSHLGKKHRKFTYLRREIAIHHSRGVP